MPLPAGTPPQLLAPRDPRRAHHGRRHGGWCLGCCWALMVALFALGVMSLAWMLAVTGLIAAEKLLPRRKAATAGAAAALIKWQRAWRSPRPACPG
jgi:predicted metal-binding membrane protein